MKEKVLECDDINDEFLEVRNEYRLELPGVAPDIREWFEPTDGQHEAFRKSAEQCVRTIEQLRKQYFIDMEISPNDSLFKSVHRHTLVTKRRIVFFKK